MKLLFKDDLALLGKEILEALKQLVQVSKDNVLVGIKSRLNFIAGNNISLLVSDNAKTKSVDIEISATSSSSSLADGDYGDVTVSGGGAVITLDPGVAVPPSRLINTTDPITGGGDLTADRTLGFNHSTDLGNNARVKVLKNGTGVAIRRGVNFIEGSNITLTVADDVANEEVDVTITSSGGGAGLTHPQVMSRALQLC